MKRNQAIVIGGSLSGLLTARVLSDHFAQVTILERDPILPLPEARKGQPQARHLHGLLASGLEVMTRYFPDLPEALVGAGAIMEDFAASMRWYAFGGRRKTFNMGVQATLMSRPLLDFLVRERVLRLTNVSVIDQVAVKRLMTTSDRDRVVGVEVGYRDQDQTTESLTADLVVDCTGRGSRTPQWLEALGYDPPAESQVRIDVGYATRLFRRDPADPGGREWMLITPDAPAESRFGALFPIEGDRWICSLGGWHGDHTPTDEDGFLEFARSLPAGDIYNFLRTAEPVSDIKAHKFPYSQRRHYEKLRRFPEGFLVLGDAISSFNPTYGQGMSSAALQAAELDQLLAKTDGVAGLAGRFFTQAAKVVDIPWQLAVGEDFRYPQTSGPKPPGVALINRYVGRVHRATLTDEVVGLAFLKVMNLMAPPTSLFHPRIMWRVLRPKQKATGMALPQPAVGD